MRSLCETLIPLGVITRGYQNIGPARYVPHRAATPPSDTFRPAILEPPARELQPRQVPLDQPVALLGTVQVTRAAANRRPRRARSFRHRASQSRGGTRRVCRVELNADPRDPVRARGFGPIETQSDAAAGFRLEREVSNRT